MSCGGWRSCHGTRARLLLYPQRLANPLQRALIRVLGAREVQFAPRAVESTSSTTLKVQHIQVHPEVHAALALGECEDGEEGLGLCGKRNMVVGRGGDKHCGYEARHGLSIARMRPYLLVVMCSLSVVHSNG